MTEELNPYQTPASVPETSAEMRRSARGQLLPVAIALVVPSILHITGGLFYFAYIYSIAAAPGTDPAEAHALTVYAMYYGISMLYCLLLITGAFSMLRQGSYLWAMTICILSLIPFLGPCYFLAVPIGIWGIVILRRPEVRESFARM